MPRERGVTSSRSSSLTSPRRMPPWMAAPMATASSGLTPLLGTFPKISCTTSCTFGTLVIPPTSRTSSTSLVVMPASLRQFLHGFLVLSISPLTKDSNFDRLSVMFKCFAPEASAVMKGRLSSVWDVDDSSIFAFSAASRSRCSASRSLERSILSVLLNSATKKSSRALSKSSPPKKVSPFVALTCKITSCSLDTRTN